MTPNDKVIITAFVHALARLDQQLPPTLQSQLNALQDVANNALQLEKIVKSNPDLAKLYGEECDRLLADASDRKKGYLPIFKSDDYNTELGNLAEQICHAPNSGKAAEDALNSSSSGKIKKFFSQLFN